MRSQDSVLEVWLDCDLGPSCLVGRLAHDRGQIRFHYERAWLADARASAFNALTESTAQDGSMHLP